MNLEIYNCLICHNSQLEMSEICKLKCDHIFCWKCIGSYLCNNLKAKTKCPDNDCQSYINDAVVRKILPEVKIQEYENLCMSFNDDQIFHCLLQECDYIVFYNSKSIQFECPFCTLYNCIDCKATHPFLSCIDYRKRKGDINNRDGQNNLKKMEDDEMERALKKLMKIKNQNLSESLRQLNSIDLVPNQEAFNCNICTRIIQKGNGIKLRKCFHEFCSDCLHDSVKISENIPIRCPNADCDCRLEDREIRGILKENEYKIYQLKCNEVVKAKIENIFHCKQPDCTFFGIVDYSQYDHFRCPVCKFINCLKCSTIHKSQETCEEFQDKIFRGENPDRRSLAFIADEIRSGKCMECPSCGAIIKKDGGCNWIQCPQCKLELCWVLKIPRWGQKGRGDISGGCKCGIDNIPCDPRCILGCIPEH